MPETPPTATFLCPVCESPVPLGAVRCPNINCKEDLSSLVLLDTSAEEMYRKGLFLLKENKIQLALELLNTAAGLEPDRLDVWVVLGKIYAQSGEFTTAARCWNKALLLQSNEPRATAGLKRLNKINQQNVWLSRAQQGLLLLLCVWLGARLFISPANNMTQVFNNNPILAAYHLTVKQNQNSVQLSGSLAGENEKNLIIAAAQVAVPNATIDGSGLVFIPEPTLPDATATLISTPTQTQLIPTETLLPTSTLTITPTATSTPHVCTVSTGVKNGWLNLRVSANEKTGVVGILNEGATLVITGTINEQGWVPVNTSDGLTGWVNIAFCQ